MRRQVVAGGAAALAVVTVAAGVALLRPDSPAGGSGGSAPVARAAEPAASSGFYVDPDTQAARWVAANPNDPRAAVIRERIARVPQGRWFTQNNTSTVRREVSSFVGAAAAAG